MDPQVSASFIPKKPLDGGGRSRERGGGFLMLICLLLFIASLLAGGAAFAYQVILQGQLSSDQTSLARAQAAFDPSSITALERLDLRINNAETLLQNHLSASAIFAFLSLETLQNVSFTSFTYAIGSDGTATLTLGGLASDFSAVALQSDQLSASGELKNIVFSNINVGQQGQVTFTVTATIDPSLINYGKNIGSTTAAVQPVSPQPQPTSSGTLTTTSTYTTTTTTISH